jgi:3-methyladenine DNA glycosylase AlkD
VVDDGTAAGVIAALEAVHDPAELAKVRSRLATDEPAIGMRMRDLFAVAEAHRDLELAEVDRLLDHPAYEPRMAAFCILDFQVRKRLDDDARRARYDLYLGRHDRITTWDMVDRAAPRVVGGQLRGRSLQPLHDLAGAGDPLRRRTAITAPLLFVKEGADDEIAEGFTVAEVLAADPVPEVHKAVGTFLKHAGRRDPERLHRFLDTYGPGMPRAAVRLAVAALEPDDRARYAG